MAQYSVPHASTSQAVRHISGFHVVYEHQATRRDEQRKVDIIAIHGIGAQSILTWAHFPTEAAGAGAAAQPAMGRRTDWLSDNDMLPSRIWNSRIMLYGYKSAWTGRDAIETTCYGLAQNFVIGLLEARTGVGYRPMIIVAHCFGGIIVMKALTMLRHRRPELLRCVIGLIFLGTPFWGVSGSLGDGRMIEHRRNRGERVQATILELLQPNNRPLYEIRQEFANIGEEALQLPQMHCYYETIETNLARLAGRDNETKLETVVTMDSASFPGCLDALPMERDHLEMNKFWGPQDLEYRKVTNPIVELAQKGPSIVRKRRRHEVSDHASVSRPPRYLNNSPPVVHISDPVTTRHPQRQSIATYDSRPPAFRSEVWRETVIPLCETSNHTYSVKLRGIKRGNLVKTRPFACGIASDGRHVFTLDEKRLTVFQVPAELKEDLVESCHLPAPSKHRFRAAKMAESFLALICADAERNRNTSIHLYKFPPLQRLWPWDQSFCDFESRCVAIRELSDCVLLAIGKTTSIAAKVEVYRITAPAAGGAWAADFLCEPIDLSLDEAGDKIGECYPAKLLEFSRDGSLLICCTETQNRVLVWQFTLGTGMCRATQLCSEVRYFNMEKDVLGVTSTDCWTSASGHPYMLVTTCPGSQRAGSSGEWSFIAPVSNPFPSDVDAAFHCLMAAQSKEYFSIVQATVAKEGNAIGFISRRGDICIMTLKALQNGGIGVVENAPLQLGRRLESPHRPHKADIAFTKDGTSLIAVDVHGTLIVAKFDAN